jgi:hypothetical protein
MYRNVIIMICMKTDRDDFQSEWQMSERAGIRSTVSPLERRRTRLQSLTPPEPLPPEMPWGRIALFVVVGVVFLIGLRLLFR